MEFVIDRYEGSYAVCETESGLCFDLPAVLLRGIKEGESVRIVRGGELLIASSDGGGHILAAEGIRAAVPLGLLEGYSEGESIGFEKDEEASDKRKEKTEKLMDELFEE